ncbi:protein maternally expressed gene 5 [Phtheirospermum japonicum]|uniref:Protein maternally expressed gene 5 n=1 Tax=Phtheirospermum japonicum TaxID=374723 RepID=A0A830C3N3_9LAMI|nr:protein maternally expressed gene 5 [Phtheirospermum japonicum]
MADPYWRYGDGRQQPAAITPQVVKRPRSEFEMPTSHEMPSYFAREDDRAGLRAIRDTESINASYDRYLLSSAVITFLSYPRVLAIGESDPAGAAKNRPILGARPEIQLPPDASSTLYVEGLPANCSRREVSHIFRPFVGYKEVRLVTKDSRHVLCFVDFLSPAHAATALDALQGNIGSLSNLISSTGVYDSNGLWCSHFLCFLSGLVGNYFK